jgi:hypothetical protein
MERLLRQFVGIENNQGGIKAREVGVVLYYISPG